MMLSRLTALLALVSLACTSAPKAPATTAWSYTGSTGPEHWGELSPDYALARTGRSQSPVDIVTSRIVRPFSFRRPAPSGEM